MKRWLINIEVQKPVSAERCVPKLRILQIECNGTVFGNAPKQQRCIVKKRPFVSRGKQSRVHAGFVGNRNYIVVRWNPMKRPFPNGLRSIDFINIFFPSNTGHSRFTGSDLLPDANKNRTVLCQCGFCFWKQFRERRSWKSFCIRAKNDNRRASKNNGKGVCPRAATSDFYWRAHQWTQSLVINSSTILVRR